MYRSRWCASEIEQLGTGYAERGLMRLALDLGRSPDAVSSQARRLGLRSSRRRRRQALSRAARNRTVNVHFFDTLNEDVAYVLGYIWSRGQVRIHPRHVLRLRCPTSEEDGLLAVRSQLGSHHRVQRRHGYTVCEICSYHLVQSLIQQYGQPPTKDHANRSLPNVPSSFAPAFARGFLAARTRVQL